MPDLTEASSHAAGDPRLNGGLAEGMPESDPSAVLKKSASRKSRETISQKKLLSVKNLLHRKDSKRVPERIPESEQAEDTVEAVKQSQTLETGPAQSKFYSIDDSPKGKGSNGSKGSKASKGSNNTSSSKRKRMEELKKRFAKTQKASEIIQPTPTSPSQDKPISAPLAALRTPDVPEKQPSDTTVQQRLDHRRLKKELKRRKRCYSRATLVIAIIAVVVSSLMLAFLTFCAYQIPKLHSQIAQATALTQIGASLKNSTWQTSRGACATLYDTSVAYLLAPPIGANLTIVVECQMEFPVREYDVRWNTSLVLEEHYVVRNATTLLSG